MEFRNRDVKFVFSRLRSFPPAFIASLALHSHLRPFPHSLPNSSPISLSLSPSLSVILFLSVYSHSPSVRLPSSALILALTSIPLPCAALSSHAPGSCLPALPPELSCSRYKSSKIFFSKRLDFPLHRRVNSRRKKEEIEDDEA